MGIFFGKSKSSRITDHDRAVLQMKQQRDTLKQYRLKVENLLEEEREIAKRLLHQNQKEKAKLLLRKAKYQREQLERTEAALDTIENLIQDLEYTQIEAKVIEGLKVGNIALKKANAMLNVEQIEQLLDETKEGIDKQKELSELLAGVLSPEDEDAVEVELDKLISEEHQKAVDKLPTVPSDDLPATVPEEAKKKEKMPAKKIALEAQ